MHYYRISFENFTHPEWNRKEYVTGNDFLTVLEMAQEKFKAFSDSHFSSYLSSAANKIDAAILSRRDSTFFVTEIDEGTYNCLS